MENTSKGKSEKKALLIGFVLILVVVLFTFFRPAFKKETAVSIKEPAAHPQISTTELLKELRVNEEIIIYDTRRPSDYYQEHIIDSVNSININQGVSPETAIIIVGYGGSDPDTEKLAKSLTSKNYSNVRILSGGMAGWKEDGGTTISSGDPTSFTDQAKIDYITTDELKNKLSGGNSNVYLLDVRASSYFNQGHIPEAQSIPLDNLEKERDSIPSGKEIVIYGNTETEGFQGGVRLFDLGFTRTKVVNGGFLEWAEKKFPTVTD